MVHIPVLQKEIIEYLDPKPNENFIDCTIGEGSHTFAIIENILPDGKVLGIDWSCKLIEKLKLKIKDSKFKNNLFLVCDNFANLKKIVEREKIKPVHGILLDLGLCSWHLEESGLGFSFQRDEPLDMRYHLNSGLTAKDIANGWSASEIERILRDYGQERFAKRITKEIIKKRKTKPIETTLQLVEVIKKATPNWYHHRKIHLATKTFQALRIAVNDELRNLTKVFPQALEVLEKKGKIVVISYHSLEDKIVKNFFKSFREKSLNILTKKPIRPIKKEIIKNPRSRSAKLRAAQKI